MGREGAGTCAMPRPEVDPGEEASTREPPGACHSCPPFVWVDDAHLLELRRDELLHLANERGRK